MKDNLGRKINYLRLSVTDRCNLRCQYCLPANGKLPGPHREILTAKEISRIVHAAASLGIEKVRITGGEPLMRPDILDICASISAHPRIKELCLTTNGIFLEKMAKPLADAGVNRVNISLDTLDSVKYRSITRTGCLSDALKGIQAAKQAGLSPIKINVVLIGGFNDGEIGDFAALTLSESYEIRFIELMPVGPAYRWDSSCFLPAQAVLDHLPGLLPLPDRQGTAVLYHLPGAKGDIGLIRPVSHCFCDSCNRIRITADGHLKGCLLSSKEIDLRAQTDEGLLKSLRKGIFSKPSRHHLSDSPAEIRRGMSQIGG